MSTLLPFIKSHRAMSEAAARMGAGQSARYSDWWNELAWVHRQAADDLQRQLDESCKPPARDA